MLSREDHINCYGYIHARLVWLHEIAQLPGAMAQPFWSGTSRGSFWMTTSTA